MYYTAKLEIDPSQITVFKKVKPTKLFSKFVDAISFGALSKKQEHETFTAVAVLQQLNIGLRSNNIKNVIRLAVDDYDFYLDEKGEEDDLEQAMFEFKTKVDPVESEFFNTIYLVLEHIDTHLKYLIEIAILRKHKIGEYPIKIKVNGVVSEFKLAEDESPEQLENRMDHIFETQELYDGYVNARKRIFDTFVDELEMAIKKYIKVDDIRKETAVQIVRPKHRITEKKQIQHERYGNPIFYGYYGYDDFLFYSMLWGSALYSHDIYCNNFCMVDDTGNEVVGVANDGFNAGDTNAFNVDAPFEPPSTGDLTYYSENEYSDILSNANLIDTTTADTVEGDSNAWLDSDDSGGDATCSSCSSCSSCGSCSSD